MTGNGALIILMGFLFLFLGYMGVPVAFALIASVLLVTVFTPVSEASMIAQIFNGMDVEALLAVPFFLLVGDLMTSANVTVRMITLSQTMVGHFRGGLAQVVTLFSMFFAGISGSSAADVAVLTRTLAPEMKREGYDRGFTAALIASAHTLKEIQKYIMANSLEYLSLEGLKACVKDGSEKFCYACFTGDYPLPLPMFQG